MRVTAPSRRSQDLRKGEEELPSSCLHCHAPMPANEDLCDQCGYHRILGKKIDLEGVRKEPKERGAKAWVQETLHDGETAGSVGVWAAVLAGVVLLVFGFLFSPVGWFLAIPLLILIGWFTITRQQAKDEQGDAYQAGAIEKFLWNLALIAVRISGFRAPHWPFPALRKAVYQSTAFDDDALAEVDELENLEALDLEGTSISDDGIGVLADCRKLQYLVLRGTHVTPETVRLLQRKLRRTWIWQ